MSTNKGSWCFLLVDARKQSKGVGASYECVLKKINWCNRVDALNLHQ